MKAVWSRFYPTLAAFMQVIDAFLDRLGDYRTELASLTTDHFELPRRP